MKAEKKWQFREGMPTPRAFQKQDTPPSQLSQTYLVSITELTPPPISQLSQASLVSAPESTPLPTPSVQGLAQKVELSPAPAAEFEGSQLSAKFHICLNVLVLGAPDQTLLRSFKIKLKSPIEFKHSILQKPEDIPLGLSMLLFFAGIQIKGRLEQASNSVLMISAARSQIKMYV
jgi:hypothetical protein